MVVPLFSFPLAVAANTSTNDMRRDIGVRYIEGLINAPNLCHVSRIALARLLDSPPPPSPLWQMPRSPGRDRFNDSSRRAFTCSAALYCPGIILQLMNIYNW